jgi:hypothetical protein
MILGVTEAAASIPPRGAPGSAPCEATGDQQVRLTIAIEPSEKSQADPVAVTEAVVPATGFTALTVWRAAPLPVVVLTATARVALSLAG